MADNQPIEGEIVQPADSQAPPVDDRDYMPTQLEVERQQAETDAKSVGVIAAGAMLLQQHHTFGQFRKKAMVMVDKPYPHYKLLHKDDFKRLAYPLMGGVTRSRIADIYDLIESTADDLTEYGNQILFGVDLRHAVIDGGTDLEALAKNRPCVWDMDDLAWIIAYPEDAAKHIWRSPHAVIKPYDEKPERLPFIMSLAGGDESVYDDIMQSLAPLMMNKKPDGVIWWVGDGANGKSTLMDAIYRIFPGQLASLTVKRLVDGRDTPSLNGVLANVVKESSEGRVEDTEIYKAIGTHENFRVHKFHSQDDMEINGNLHHIFSANSIPTFNDKGFSARRRTYIIPFTQTFESDPLFEEKTFTNVMFGQLIAEMSRYAVKLRQQGYRYKWSATTLAAKAKYDADANNAEVYCKYLIDSGVVAFDSFNPVRMDYESWCADNGFVPLGIMNLRKAVAALGFDRTSQKDSEGKVSKLYRLPVASNNTPLAPLSAGRPGLYTLPGFQPEEEKTAVPDFPEPPAKPEQQELETETTTTTTTKKSILNTRW